MAVIFKNVKCEKGKLYDLLLQTMIDNGWQNISSHPLDGDVMYSSGKDGNRKIYVQLYPYDVPTYKIKQESLDNKEYNIRTSSTSNAISIRLCLKYTPGTEGKSGVFARPDKANLSDYFSVSIVNNAKAVIRNAVCDCDYYCDKNKIIFVTKAPEILAGNRQMILLGQTDTIYYNSGEYRGTMCAANCSSVDAPYISDYINPNSGSSGGAIAVKWMALVINNKHYLFEPFCASGATVLGRLDGMYWMGTGLPDGDIIRVGETKFKVINIATTMGDTMYNTSRVALQIDEEEKA